MCWGLGSKEHQGLKQFPCGQVTVQPLSAQPQVQGALLLGQPRLFQICSLEYPPWVLALPLETHTMLVPWPWWPLTLASSVTLEGQIPRTKQLLLPLAAPGGN